MRLFREDLELSVIPPLNQMSSGSDELFNGQQLVSYIQRFRGNIYVEDGAIPQSALDLQGRHRSEFDFYCYHICLRTVTGELAGALRVRLYGNDITPSGLNLYALVVRSAPEIRPTLVKAIAETLQEARNQGLKVGEVGGWAVDRTLSGSANGILLPLAGWGLVRQLGNAIIIAAATSKHSSAEILVRLGGYYLRLDGRVVPEFYDPDYRCGMRLLVLNSRSIAAKYQRFIPKIQFVPLAEDPKHAAETSRLEQMRYNQATGALALL